MDHRIIGIVPAGGKGSRLAPYPGPKELFPLGWQPYSVNGEVHRRPKVVSQYVIENIARAGATRIIMVVGEHKHDILRYYGCGQRYGVHIAYVFQEEPLGMLHAIDLAYPWVRGSRILFGMPDTIIHPSEAFSVLLREHRARPCSLTMGLFVTQRPEKFGMVELDADGRVAAHIDKPRQTHLTMMWGCAVWEPEFTDLIHEIAANEAVRSGRERVLGDAFDEALRRGITVRGYRFADGTYIDIGTYDEIVEAQLKIRELQR